MATAKRRFQSLMQQAELGEQLKREFRRKGVTVVAVERAMGLSPTTLNHYLRASRPWPGGLSDFEAKVRDAIEAAVLDREVGVA
jgi:transcriptional regulator with XRE-family HTH domain